MKQRRLFNAGKPLLNISRSASLLLSTDDHQLANNFGEFFTKKMNAIRLEIILQTRFVLLISAIPIVLLLVKLFQNSTFCPNVKYMTSLHRLQRSLVLLIPSQPNLLLNSLMC